MRVADRIHGDALQLDAHRQGRPDVDGMPVEKRLAGFSEEPDAPPRQTFQRVRPPPRLVCEAFKKLLTRHHSLHWEARAQRLGPLLRSSTQPYQPSPKGLSL
jgi:hypothetical protein